MRLVDTSVWIHHFRAGVPSLVEALETAQVLIHRHIIGELAMGALPKRVQTLRWLRNLPNSVHAQDDEVLNFIDQRNLHGRGIGFTDAHLLAATHLTPHARLWTRDRRLAEAAHTLGVGVAHV